MKAKNCAAQQVLRGGRRASGLANTPIGAGVAKSVEKKSSQSYPGCLTADERIAPQPRASG